jgi:hypothetical protein
MASLGYADRYETSPQCRDAADGAGSNEQTEQDDTAFTQ